MDRNRLFPYQPYSHYSKIAVDSVQIVIHIFVLMSRNSSEYEHRHIRLGDYPILQLKEAITVPGTCALIYLAPRLWLEA